MKKDVRFLDSRSHDPKSHTYVLTLKSLLILESRQTLFMYLDISLVSDIDFVLIR